MDLIGRDGRVDDNLRSLVGQRLDQSRFPAAVLPGEDHPWTFVFVNDEDAEELRSLVRWKLVEQFGQALGEPTYGGRGRVK